MDEYWPNRPASPWWYFSTVGGDAFAGSAETLLCLSSVTATNFHQLEDLAANFHVWTTNEDGSGSETVLLISVRAGDTVTLPFPTPLVVTRDRPWRLMVEGVSTGEGSTSITLVGYVSTRPKPGTFQRPTTAAAAPSAVENMGVVQRGYDALADGDHRALADLFAEDAEWKLTGKAKASRTFRGRRGVVGFLRRVRDVRLETIASHGDYVVAVHSYALRAGVREIATTVYEVADGKVVVAECQDLARPIRILASGRSAPTKPNDAATRNEIVEAAKPAARRRTTTRRTG